MNRIKRNLFHAFGAALIIGAASCSDDININGSSTGESSTADGPVVGFTMNLGALGEGATSRSLIYGSDPSSFESYIDKNKVRVLMFASDGTFLYEPKELNPIPLENNANGDNQWYVEIMGLQNLKTTAGGNGEISVLDYIKTNPFKIAVLANWPTEAEAIDDDGRPRYAQYEFVQGQHLKQLSHFFLDNNYYDGDDDAYEHIVFRTETENYDYDNSWIVPAGKYQTGENYMGVTTKWIEQQFKSRDEANAYIRANYNVPEESSVTGLTASSGAGNRTYKNIWQVWNFGGSSNTFESFAGDRADDWGKYNDKTVVAELELDKQPTDSITIDNLTVRPKSGSTNYKRVTGFNGNVGFMMPRYGTNYDSETNAKNAAVPVDGYLRLFAWADAKIRVKAGVAHTGSSTPGNVWLTYRVEGKSYTEQVDVKGTPTQDTANGLEFYDIVEFKVGNSTYDDGSKYVNTKTTPLEVYMYAACSNGDDRLVIYEIEYIADDYLYKVDRWGLAPSRENPIPMYGVQDFMPIGEYFKDNEIFNLSVYNGVSTPGYEYRNVGMLRSIARVDVMLPKSIFPEPESIFMRSLNHSARCAPMDLYTPTDIIWNGATGGYDTDKWADDYSGVVGATQELENIRAYGPTYMQGNLKENNPNYLHDFQVRTSWFFGLWNDWGWQWNGVLDPSEVPTSKPFPRVFNTALSRADYANFIPVDDSQYWHYVLYTPEKNITDADNAGELGQRPKLIHIEVRFKDRNPTNYYDDNSAYRIYFTQGGLSMGRNEFDDLETGDVTYDDLTRFYPVIRNHNYRFTVTGINQGDLQFEVRSAGNRDVNIGFN